MRMFAGMRVSASGLEAERTRMDIISNNIANVNSPGTPGEETFRAQKLVTAPAAPRFGDYLAGFRRLFPEGGVEILGVRESVNPPRMVYEPSNPDADENGYVSYPDINIIDEMVDSIRAYRSYEANLTAFNETKRMFNKAMEIGK
jgi:flagellar basal-body rod protein FlgC